MIKYVCLYCARARKHHKILRLQLYPSRRGVKMHIQIEHDEYGSHAFAEIKIRRVSRLNLKRRKELKD